MRAARIYTIHHRAPCQAPQNISEVIAVSSLRTANLLGALAGEIADRLDRLLRHHPNQTDSAAAALNLVGFYEGCSNTRLSQALRLSHPATVRLVDKLEADGLVESRPGADRRSVALYLTERGRGRSREILVQRCAALSDIVDNLTGPEQQQLTALMEKLLRNLTSNADHADHICRLCDESACPPESCPVHQVALVTIG
jgi:MarR family transcriptional repressor of emrRAB